MRSRTTKRARRARRGQSAGGGLRWLLLLVLAVAAVGIGGAMLDSPDAATTAPANSTVTPTPMPAPSTPTVTLTSTPQLDPAAVATAINEQVNRVREEHNRMQLAHEGKLQTAARRHSQVMAEEGDIFHQGPDGDLQDRLRRAGYDCRVPVGGNRYSTGSENVAKTWYRVPIEGGHYYDTPEELARGLVEQWLGSPGHRDILLGDHWRRHGAAVAVVEEPEGTAVYATQIFC